MKSAILVLTSFNTTYMGKASVVSVSGNESTAKNLSGDGRADSPGHGAKYGSYSNIVIDWHDLQRGDGFQAGTGMDSDCNYFPYYSLLPSLLSSWSSLDSSSVAEDESLSSGSYIQVQLSTAQPPPRDLDPRCFQKRRRYFRSLRRKKKGRRGLRRCRHC